VTISSDGFVHLYDLSRVLKAPPAGEDPPKHEPVVSYDTKGSRLTCVAFAEGDMVAEAAEYRENGDDEKEESETDEEEEAEEEDDEFRGFTA